MANYMQYSQYIDLFNHHHHHHPTKWIKEVRKCSSSALHTNAQTQNVNGEMGIVERLKIIIYWAVECTATRNS